MSREGTPMTMLTTTAGVMRSEAAMKTLLIIHEGLEYCKKRHYSRERKSTGKVCGLYPDNDDTYTGGSHIKQLF